MSYFKDENKNPLDYYGLRQPASKQELMPLYQNASKPTRDINAYNRSHSLNKQQISVSSNSRILIQKRLIQLQKQLEESDFQRQANIVYNKQYRELGRLLGDQNMQFDQIKGKIQHMILQEPIQNQGTHRQTNLNLHMKSTSLLKEQIQQLKLELTSQNNIKQILIQKVQRHQVIQSQLRFQNIQLNSEAQHLRRQLQSSKKLRHFDLPFLSKENSPGHQNISTRSKQFANYNGMEISSTNLVLRLKQRDNQIDEKSKRIRQLLVRLEKNECKVTQDDNTQSQFSRKYNEIQKKYLLYVTQYEKLQEQLKNYEYKISQNEMEMQKYQQMEGSFELLQKNYAQIQNKLQQSKKYQDQVNKYNSQVKGKLIEYQQKISESQNKQFQSKNKLSVLEYKVIQYQGRIFQLQYQIRVKNQQIAAHKQKARQGQNQMIKLGEHIGRVNDDLRRHEENSLLGLSKADQLAQKQLIIKQNQATIQQYREQISQGKSQIRQLAKRTQQMSEQVRIKCSQLSNKHSLILGIEQQLQLKTTQLNNYQTRFIELKQSYYKLKALHEQRSTQIVDLTRQCQHLVSRNQQLQQQKQELFQLSIFNKGQKLQANSQLLLRSESPIYGANSNQQETSRLSMQRILNLTSNINPNDHTTTNSNMRKAEFVGNNTIQGGIQTYKQEYKYQLSNINGNKQNFTQNQRQLQQKAVNYDISRQQNNYPNHGTNLGEQKQNHNEVSVNEKLAQVQDSSQNIHIGELTFKINLLQTQLNIVRKSSDSKCLQIQNLEKRIQQLQITVLQLNRKIDSHQLHHQSSNRQNAKQYNVNLRNQASNNIQAPIAQNQIIRQVLVSSKLHNSQQNQSIYQLIKKSCVQQSQNKKGIQWQSQLYGSSFKQYQEKSGGNSHDVLDQNNQIENKGHSIQNRNASEINKQEQHKNRQQDNKQANQSQSHTQRDELPQEISNHQRDNSFASQHSLSKLVMGQDNINSIRNIHNTLEKRMQSRSKIQSKSAQVEQANKQGNSNSSICQKHQNGSIHEKILDFSVDKQSMYSSQTYKNKHNLIVGQELPQYRNKTVGGQLGIVTRKMIVDEITRKDKEYPQNMTGAIENSPVYDKNHADVHNDRKMPLSTIMSNQNIESVREQGSKESNQIPGQKRRVSDSSTKKGKRASASPGRISISYGRESKVIYTASIQERQNSLTNQQDRRATLPLVSTNQIKDVSAKIRHSQISSSSHVIFNNNLRSSRTACDDSATVRPHSREKSRQVHVVSRFRNDQGRLSRQDIQRQTLVNDQYLPLNQDTLQRSRIPNIKGTYHKQVIYRPPNSLQQPKINQNVIYSNPISPRNSQLSQPIRSNNRKRLDIDESQVFIGVSPSNNPQQQHKSGLFNSQMSRFNVVKQSKITSFDHNDTPTSRNNQYLSSFAQRIQQPKSFYLTNPVAANNSFRQDFNNVSVTSQDSGINVFQNQPRGFNCCSR